MKEIKYIKGKNEAAKLFNQIHKTCSIDVSIHATNAHPNRGFTKAEITDLVRLGSQIVDNNKCATAKPGSWMLLVKDQKGRRCEIAFFFEEEGDEIKITIINVFHAWRDVK